MRCVCASSAIAPLLSASAPCSSSSRHSQSRRRSWRCRTRCRCRPERGGVGGGRFSLLLCFGVARRRGGTKAPPVPSPLPPPSLPRTRHVRVQRCRQRAQRSKGGRGASGASHARIAPHRVSPLLFLLAHRKPQQQARLAHARVADEEQLEEVVAEGEGRRGGNETRAIQRKKKTAPACPPAARAPTALTIRGRPWRRKAGWRGR